MTFLAWISPWKPPRWLIESAEAVLGADGAGYLVVPEHTARFYIELLRRLAARHRDTVYVVLAAPAEAVYAAVDWASKHAKGRVHILIPVVELFGYVPAPAIRETLRHLPRDTVYWCRGGRCAVFRVRGLMDITDVRLEGHYIELPSQPLAQATREAKARIRA